MNSYEQSARSRYWRETAQSAFQSVDPRQQRWNAHAGLGLLAVFAVTILAMVVMRKSDDGAVLFVLIFGIVCARPFLGRLKGDAGALPPGQPIPGATAQSQNGPGDLDRLLNTLENLDKRLANLEAVVTQKEFDWERRLYQDPAPGSAHAAAAPPV
jgi:hypothetical protein